MNKLLHITNLPEIHNYSYSELLRSHRETFFFDGVFSFDIKYLISIAPSNLTKNIVYDAGVLNHSGKEKNGLFVRHSFKDWISLLELNIAEQYGIFSEKHHRDVQIFFNQKYKVLLGEHAYIGESSYHTIPVDIEDEAVKLRHNRKNDFVDITLYEEVSNAVFNKQIRELENVIVYYPLQSKNVKYYMTGSISTFIELAKSGLLEPKLTPILQSI